MPVLFVHSTFAAPVSTGPLVIATGDLGRARPSVSLFGHDPNMRWGVAPTVLDDGERARRPGLLVGRMRVRGAEWLRRHGKEVSYSCVDSGL